MMHAAWYEHLGSAREVLRLGELPLPQPGPGQVRVRLKTSGVNPSDVKNRSGHVFSQMPFALIVPHSDGAGIVDAIGEGVDPARLGQRVWVWNAQFRRPYGTAAQQVVVPQAQAVPMPQQLSFEEAACLGIPALTAWRAVAHGEDVQGATVLVCGGAGAVGHYAVQFAKCRGARVIATAGGAASMGHAQSAGADVVLDYRRDDLAGAVLKATGGAGVQRVIEVEFGLNHERLLPALQQEGTWYVYGSAARMTPAINVQPLMMRGVSLHFRSVYLMPDAVRAAAIEDIHRLVREGRLRHAVGAVFPLQQVAQAHEAVEQRRVLGNVVVRLPD